jgi:hypothetical protein
VNLSVLRTCSALTVPESLSASLLGVLRADRRYTYSSTCLDVRLYGGHARLRVLPDRAWATRILLPRSLEDMYDAVKELVAEFE